MDKEDRAYFTKCMRDIILSHEENKRLLKDIIFNLNALGWAVVAIMFIGALFMLSVLM